ncbi:MAG: 50S ribosomal protein L4 [Eubacterium sp.]|jgi:50S ribosomal protein L4, bacterial/organelle|nr:50S ribosomal protein L4 [Eubacterium sp.]
MATVSVLNTDGKEVEKLELSDKIFGVEINEAIVHKAVVTTLANRRQGTQSALTRSEVSGGGRKPWRQKGTGHARQGSIRAPQWTGGGVVFAPKPRDYSKKINKKEARLALFSALTAKVQENKLIVVDELTMNEPKTKDFVKILSNINATKALIVLEGENNSVVLSARNIPDVKTETRNAINVYDVVKYDSLVITKDAVKALEEVYA